MKNRSVKLTEFWYPEKKLIAVLWLVVGRYYKTPENIVSPINQNTSNNLWNAIRKQNISVGRQLVLLA